MNIVKRRQNPITLKIKEEYGTVVRFCRVHNINKETFYGVINGFQRSNSIPELLVQKGIISTVEDIPIHQNFYNKKS